MKRLRSYIGIYVLSLTLVPIVVMAKDISEVTSPWSLGPGWWKEVVGSSPEETEQRLQTLLQSLRHLEKQVPDDSREQVRYAVDTVAQNVERYLRLRSTKGWAIEAAPETLDTYSIDELLAVVRQVKADESELADTTDRLRRLEVVVQRATTRIDELMVEYLATPEKSLQRTMTGLSLMVTMTNRAVLKQRIRIKSERLAGVEQRALWNRGILSHARDRLDFTSIDLAEVESQISKSVAQERSFEKELLQTEAELISNGSTDYLDSRAVEGVSRLIAYSRTKAAIVVGQAKRGLVALSQAETETAQVHVLWEGSKSWLRQLDEMQAQAEEWDRLIRREQDAAESLLLASEDDSAKNQREFVEFHRQVRAALTNLEALKTELFQARILTRLVSDYAVHRLHWFSSLWERAYSMGEGVTLGVMDSLSYPLFRFNDRPVTPYKLLRFLAIIVIAYGVSLLVRRMLKQIAQRKPHISNGSLYTFNRVAHYVILLIGVIWALSSIGIDFSNLLIIAGALSVGIGFGLQGIVNNFLGGLIVLFDRKLRVGDFIELSDGQMGHITEVNVQNTVIRTLTGHDVLVPNSDIITRQLTNWTLRDQFARLHLPFGVAYGSDKEKVKAVVEEAALRVEETLTNHKTIPGPTVWLVGFGDSSLDFELVVWVDFKRSKKRQSSLRAAYYWEIETALVENGLEIPFPQRDVHLKSGGERQREKLKK